MMYTLHAFIPNITMSILAAGFVVWGFLGEGGGGWFVVARPFFVCGVF